MTRASFLRLSPLLLLAAALVALAVFFISDGAPPAQAQTARACAIFGTGGKVTTDIGSSSNDDAYGVAVQSDGKIVVAGESNASGSRTFALARYNADGSLDTSFGSNGRVTTLFGTVSIGLAMALQPDDKILVGGAGRVTSQAGVDFVLARYNANGSLDNSFDGDGKVNTDIGSGSTDYIWALAVQSDGKIVAAGYSATGGDDDFALARYNADGSLDDSFDGDGKVTTPIGAGRDRAFDVALQSDGKIVAAGQSRNASGNDDFALARYNADGSLDTTTFSNDGKVTTDLASNNHEIINAVALQPDGKIVAAGRGSNGSTHDFVLARYNADGSLDNSFDSDGKKATDFAGNDDEVFAMALQSDGKIVVAGRSDIGPANEDFALARYNADGSLDASFGSDGKVTTSISAARNDHGERGDDRARGLALLSDGRIVVAGHSREVSADPGGTGPDDFALVRYNADGSLDVICEVGGLYVQEGYKRLRMSWSAPPGELTGYQVEYKEASAPDQPASFVDGRLDPSTGWIPWHRNGLVPDEEIFGLKNGTEYNARVRGVNADGKGPWSEYTGAPTEKPFVQLSAPPGVQEGSPVTVGALLSEPLSRNVTIPLTITDDTAEPSDHGTLGSITIRAGQTWAEGTITTRRDADPDHDTFTVSVSTDGSLPASVYAGYYAGSARITIEDLDAPTVSLSIADLSLVPSQWETGVATVPEGRNVPIKATLSQALDQDVTIPLEYRRNTAEEDDYEPLRGITIRAGQTMGQGVLRTNRDADADDETLVVLLARLTPVVQKGSPAAVHITIRDDASPANRGDTDREGRAGAGPGDARDRCADADGDDYSAAFGLRSCAGDGAMSLSWNDMNGLFGEITGYQAQYKEASAPDQAATARMLDTRLLVSNHGQSTGGSYSSNNAVNAQSFTTGSAATGYTLTGVEAVLEHAPNASQRNAIRAELWSSDSGGAPGSKLYDLTVPAHPISAGAVAFAAPANARLAASSTYHFLLYTTGGFNMGIDYVTTTDEDSGGADGWTISDRRHWTSGQTPSASSTWNEANDPLRMTVKGFQIPLDPELDPSTGWVDAGYEGEDRSVTITGLTNFREYVARVRATYAGGYGPWVETRGTPMYAGALGSPTSVSLSISPNPAQEGQRVTLTATLNDLPPLEGARVYFFAPGVPGTGNAHPISDFTLSPPSGAQGSTAAIRVNPGETTATAYMDIKTGGGNEGDETVGINVYVYVSGTTLGDSGTLTIEEPQSGDPNAGRSGPVTAVTLALGQDTVDEDVGQVMLTATLNQPAPAGGLELRLYADNESTATRDTDYTMPESVTVPYGGLSASTRIRITDDALVESDETAVVGVFAQTDHATLQDTATLTILDDDAAPQEQQATPQGKYADLIAQMYGWRNNDPQWSGVKAHTDRWDRALLAFGETVADASITPMTAAEAQALADQAWGTRWVPVAKALWEIEGNRAPTVASGIADITIVGESGTKQVSLSGVFSDPDGDSLSISAASSNNSVATVSVAADGSSLTVSAQSQGTATITVTADDGKVGAAEDSFTVTVSAPTPTPLTPTPTPAPQQQGQDPPANEAPTVASALADITIVSESGTKQVSLTGTFSDADNDSLTITAASSNNAVATVSVAADQSGLTVSARARGTATITVTADDGNGGAVSDAFTVTVKAAPVVASALADLSLKLGGTHDISLSGVFSDADGDALTFSATSTDLDVANPLEWYGELTIIGGLAGSATVTVTAQDSDGNSVSDEFDVTVAAPQQAQDPPPNRAPTVSSAIADMSDLEIDATRRAPLDGVFHDADGDTLTVTAASSDEAVATVSVAPDGSLLTVEGVSDGATTITVTAQDSAGNRVSDDFEVTVLAEADVTIVSESGMRTVSLSDALEAADGDSFAITAASSDERVATVSVDTGGSSLSVTARAMGRATVTVTADDGNGGAVEDSFTVRVKAAPVLAAAIADFSLEGPEHREFDLDDVFDDPDGGELTFTAVSSDYRAASMWVEGSTLTVVGTGTGTATITVTAQDSDGNRVSDEFEVTVSPFQGE